MTPQVTKWILVLPLVLFIDACSNDGPEHQNLSEKIDYLIEDDRYEEALGVLEQENRDDPVVLTLLEKTYLNYGLHNMNTFDEREMRTRMNDALRQFIEVLKINSDNEVAADQIDQILQVYRTIPDRQPEEDVVEGLNEVGISL